MLLGVAGFIGVATIRILQSSRENNPLVSEEVKIAVAQAVTSGARSPRTGISEAAIQSGTNQSSDSGALDLPTPDSVMKRLPPGRLELELSTNTDKKASMEFAARYGIKALGQIRAMQRLREVVEREHLLRQRAEALWEGMSITQLLEQMGNPRTINHVEKGLLWEKKPDNQQDDAFPLSVIQGRVVQLLYSSHQYSYQDQLFGNPPYKVLYLSIDGRGTLTKWEWVECCAGMD